MKLQLEEIFVLEIMNGDSVIARITSHTYPTREEVKSWLNGFKSNVTHAKVDKIFILE